MSKYKYAVILKDKQTGNEQVSRYFNTLAAARRWMKWINKGLHCYTAHIMNQVGGIRV